ncbi:ABC transporter permease [Microbacterium jiangjiandongii]|uniref:ABC transporter permease n=1 Tax=Microbacterium jiangjiandongii TaxID=3049071 RepID=UPI00214C48D7|nr:ABC transporter permease [Microbacterium sp. zg.Y843]MCR2816622.1 ABC transporter permease [Microbacterium sp. zg.Y843]
MTSSLALPAAGVAVRSALAVYAAAVARSTRAIVRSPALLISPLAQSLFFLIVYAGQLGTVGEGYLGSGGFIAFLLPLILLTGAATGAGAAGTLVLRDLDTGYLDRLRLAHGSNAPFLAGAVVAALATVMLQTAVTIAGAVAIGYRPHSTLGVAAMAGLLTALALGIALLSIAVAIRTRSAASTGLVPLAVFGLSFFTGVFAPVDELTPWMRTIATVNPLTYVIDAARQLERAATVTALPIALAALVTLILAGIASCTLASAHARRNR